MIKLYRIKIGEKVYEVELEEVTEKEGKVEVIENKTEVENQNEIEDLHFLGEEKKCQLDKNYNYYKR